MSEPTHDVVILGGGHNGLVAAAYLAQAGRRVLVLEREPQVGGAAISADAFPGMGARLSRYSYLVSLLPTRIIRELGLDIELARRRYSSYTPGHSADGLLVDHGDAAATQASFVRIGAAADFDSWTAFYDHTARLARAVFPTVCEPLLTRSEARRLVGDDALWTSLIERPLGEVITDRFDNDLVRGVAATDGLIGTFTSLTDPSLAANRCFLYHVIGNGTGDWDVPIGGMGAVTGELERAAREAGARLELGADVESLTPDGAVTYRQNGRLQAVTGGVVLANVAPWVLRELLAVGGGASALSSPAPPKPEGAQVKVNLLLTRLPRLHDASVSGEAAFGGTFHINESYEQLQTAFEQALAGQIPAELSCEIYCHSLTDPSILSPELAAAGAHTLTVFALHTPNRALTEANNASMRALLQAAVLTSLNSVLAEPIEALLMADADGRPCIETKTTLDLEHALNLPGGNIFHGPLSWPFLEDDEPRSTPAERWGVATEHPRILICGAGARRGGGVSGLGGHNAAMAVLEGL
ncbi:NAD(P)/FAD-dependent oxidoreductase [Cryobacterium sp. PH31-O1]|uniref:phytoene desaturase family protein n=1 Tax=Cryobacterium sp. PH31-O1 TaxID=3046306 RepID=UPI0024B8C86E|nr:NAD(P)/FAD-dependent oxidoreductase [Cryobacterium sp. PH31-O1]MDJ0339825.1 NAD(P)/FAD-dependent oxidoreductase [Cryobacterium sp. PH31-O1]